MTLVHDFVIGEIVECWHYGFDRWIRGRILNVTYSDHFDYAEIEVRFLGGEVDIPQTVYHITDRSHEHKIRHLKEE